MHEHLEIIMPKTSDIGGDIDAIMKPFSEHNENAANTFWDWFVIGGRWAGTKETCGYANEKIEAFYDALKEAKVTVSGLQAGKQEISPASQIPKVDTLWNKFFPTENGEIIPCPLFKHSNNQYNDDDLISCDICRVEEIPTTLVAARAIIAGPDYDGESVKAHYMISQSHWNGVNFTKSGWDGNVKSAIEMARKDFKHYREEYRVAVTPKADWICVTVDYHS